MRRGAVVLAGVVAVGAACTEHLLLPAAYHADGGSDTPANLAGTGGKVTGTGGRVAGTGGAVGAAGAGGTSGAGAAGGTAPAGGTSGQDGRGGFGGGPKTGGGGRGVTCQVQKIMKSTQRAELLFSLGKNASMGTKFGDVGGTRLSVVQQTLQALIEDNQYAVSFGYQEFPSAASCGMTDGCCVKPDPILPSPSNSQGRAIPQALSCMPGMPPFATAGCVSQLDTRPIGTALENAASTIFNTTDFSDRYVVLIVDGDPNCVAEQSCDKAISQLRTLGLNHVQTHVVAVGLPAAVPMTQTAPCLANIALQANTNLVMATVPMELEQGLASIVSEAASSSCLLRLAPADPNTISLFVQGQEVRRDTPNGGWDFVPGGPLPKIQVKGVSCSLIQKAQDRDIEVFGCPF